MSEHDACDHVSKQGSDRIVVTAAAASRLKFGNELLVRVVFEIQYQSLQFRDVIGFPRKKDVNCFQAHESPGECFDVLKIMALNYRIEAGESAVPILAIEHYFLHMILFFQIGTDKVLPMRFIYSSVQCNQVGGACVWLTVLSSVIQWLE